MNDIKKKWSNVRSGYWKYVRKLNLQHAKSGGDGNKLREYKWYKQMTFLGDTKLAKNK